VGSIGVSSVNQPIIAAGQATIVVIPANITSTNLIVASVNLLWKRGEKPDRRVVSRVDDYLAR